MFQRDAIVPIVPNLHPVHLGPVDRAYIRRFLRVPVAERRPPVRIFDIRERVPGIRIQIRHESERVVVNHSVCIREGLERCFERGVCRPDDGSQRVPLRGRGDAEEVGPERHEVFGVEVSDEDVGRAGGQERGDQRGDLGRNVGGELRVFDRVGHAERAEVAGVHVVGADP